MKIEVRFPRTGHAARVHFRAQDIAGDRRLFELSSDKIGLELRPHPTLAFGYCDFFDALKDTGNHADGTYWSNAAIRERDDTSLVLLR